ncbi:MAG: S1 RNA-binding domain-containing protein [Patescibacteria group bacterium]|nr:S1 RNA-binding domain-containing protein [Patescibacteria group bacterium]
MAKKKNEEKNTQQKTNIMDDLLKKYQPKIIKKGSEIEAKIVSLSKKGIVFDIGAKAYAQLGELEIKEVSTYLPYLKPGDKIQVKVISEESKNGYPVVSLRKFFEKGKWEILKEKKDKEEEIEVVCGEYGKGGIFVDFMGIRGVIPKIQLTEPFISNPEKLNGQKIKVKILEVNKEKNRLVVSQKASALKISQKELKERFDAIKEGKVYKAKVLGASEFGVFCEVEGVEGLVHISEISWEKVSNASAYVKPGEIIDVYVVERNEKDLKLNLSLKRLTPDPWEKIEEKYPKDKEIEGEIVRKEKYGYFVRLEPGIEGLIHISKLKGDENIKIGDKIKAYVERISLKDRKMSLVLPQKEKPVFYR